MKMQVWMLLGLMVIAFLGTANSLPVSDPDAAGFGGITLTDQERYFSPLQRVQLMLRGGLKPMDTHLNAKRRSQGNLFFFCSSLGWRRNREDMQKCVELFSSALPR